MEQRTPIEIWADNNLATDIEIRLRSDSTTSKIVVAIIGSILGLFLISLPIWILVGELLRGRSTDRQSSLAFPVVFLCLVVIVIASILFVIWNARRRLAKILTSYGVVTRNGRLHIWTELRAIEFIQVYVRRANSVDGAVHQMMFSGHERLKCHLVFSDGIAVIPPLIHEQARILELIQSMPTKQEWKR